MKVVKESQETAIWLKIVLAFVAGLVLSGAGALILVKNLAPKSAISTPQESSEAGAPPSTLASDAASSARPAEKPPDKQTPSESSADGRVAAPGKVAPAVVKKHPSAFGDQVSKQAVARVTPPKPQPQNQPPENAPQREMQPQATAQQPPEYAPAPDVTPVTPQTAVPQQTVPQEMRQDRAEAEGARQPQTITIALGTSLMVRVGETISTKTKVAGDPFRGTLDQPIILNGFVIADKGSKVTGRVVSSQKGGHLSGSSDLSLQITEIHTTDGQTVHVETSPWEKKGESNAVGNVAKIGGGALLGAIIGSIASGGKGAAIGAASGGAAGTGVAAATGGKPTVIPVETLIAFRLDAPVTITEQINN